MEVTGSILTRTAAQTCVCSAGVCSALPYSNYIVCLSHTIAVPVFVVPRLRSHARNATMAFAVF